MKVFLVDDSAVVLKRLEELISECSDVIVVGSWTAVHGTAERIRASDADVVILDIRLEDGSGLDVLRELKEQQPEIAVIVFTNYSYLGYRERCLKAGADYFLTKHEDFHRLPDILDHLSSEPERSSERSPENDSFIIDSRNGKDQFDTE